MKTKIILTGILAFSLLGVTGCSDKTAVKPNNNNNNNKTEQTDKNKDSNSDTSKESNNGSENSNNNNNTNTNNNNTQTATQSSKSQHNFAAATEIARNGIMNYYEYKDSSSAAMSIQYFAAANSKQDEITTIPIGNILDKLNTFNNQTITKEQLLNDLRNQTTLSYKVIDDNSLTYPKDLLRNQLERFNIIYFSKNDSFTTISKHGLGGASSYTLSSQDKWTINGDEIIIPVLNSSENKTMNMPLKLNNKKYENGSLKTMYYIKSFR